MVVIVWKIQSVVMQMEGLIHLFLQHLKDVLYDQRRLLARHEHDGLGVVIKIELQYLVVLRNQYR